MKKIIIGLCILLCFLLLWYFVVPKNLGGNSFYSPAVSTSVVISQNLIYTPTSTVANPFPLVKYYNNQNLLCDTPELDISTANGLFGQNISVGTTTSKYDLSLANTSTKTLIGLTRINTSTVGIMDEFGGLNITTAAGTYYKGTDKSTSTPWILNTGTYVVVYSDFAGATSSDSFKTTGGLTSVAKLKIKCIKRF